jgi:glutamate--cysteine ligase
MNWTNESDFKWGIERETHRILSDGSLSPAPHPDSLKGPSFTKDFAESQLELVTEPHESIEGALAELESLTAIARTALGGERFWPFSMPPRLPARGGSLAARMGTGEEARLAERYRRGLSARYGVARQMICGVHLNVSFGPRTLEALRQEAPLSAEERGTGTESDGYYLRLARNLLDDLPSLVMLFGASPTAECENGRSPPQIAYSLRNSPLGYARTEYRPFLNLDSIKDHVAAIRRGLKTESEEFRKLGLIRDGESVQLNGRVFQKDKEFYAPIRFRRATRPGESALGALEARGVEYLELRFLDVDPGEPSGVSREALMLARLFVLSGLSRESRRRDSAGLAGILRAADEAALGDPREKSETNARLAALLARLDSLVPLARDAGPAHERALSRQRARMAKGESTAAALARDYLESGLGWTEYGAMTAASRAKGEMHGITA